MKRITKKCGFFQFFFCEDPPEHSVENTAMALLKQNIIFCDADRFYTFKYEKDRAMENQVPQILQEAPNHREEKMIRISFIPPGIEIRGHTIQDTLLLLRKAWWFYLLMLAILGIFAFCLRDSIAAIIPGIIGKFWPKK